MTYRASSIERVSLCPGSARLESQCPDVPSGDSEFGTRVAAWMAKELPDEELYGAELEVATRLLQSRQEILTEWLGTESLDEEYTETEIVMDIPALGARLIGHPDIFFVAFDSPRVLIVDEKSIRWGEHAPSTSNLQLRTYAVLVAEDEPSVQSATVAINQDGKRPSPCTYNASDLAQAREEIFAIIAEAEKPDAPLNPGEKQCRFCKAKAICPALIDAREGLKLTAPANKADAGLWVSVLTDAALSRILPALKPVEWHIEAIRAEARKRLESNPDAIPGWTLKDGKRVREVSDIGTLTNRLAALGISWEAITAECSITLGSTEALVKEQTGKKGKALTEAVNDVLEDCVMVKTCTASLVRTKEQLESVEAS